MENSNSENLIRPKFRYALKASIIKAGYRTLTDFSNESGIDLPKISRICSGWEIPSLKIQKGMARTLGVTLSELGTILKIDL